MSSQPQGPPSGPSQTSRIVWLWWVMLLGLMLWNVISLWPRATPTVTLPYTAFLAQVRADNVARVRLAGADISGDFVKPVRWPESTPSTPSSTPPPSQPPSGGFRPTRA